MKGDILTEISSSYHYPLCSIVCDASTCDGETPCYSISSSNELTSQFIQGGEDIHDERQNNQIIEYSFDPSPSLVLHKYNSSN